MKQLSFLAVVFVLTINLVYGQGSFGQMMRRDTSNFFDIKRDFDAFWENKKVTRGSGWKQFKRWEWYWENRVNKDGTFPPSGMVPEAFQRFKRDYGKASRSVQANWESVGPNSTLGAHTGIGRINSLAFHPTDTSIIYAGAGGGGFWKSTDGGINWFTTTDHLASLGVSGIVVHPTNPNIIYIATGDGDAYDNYSIGVLRSMDGGNTFNTTGLNWATTDGRVIRRIIMDKDDPNIIMVATSVGIYRTTDGGNLWLQVAAGNFYDIEAKPGINQTIFYASTQSQVYRSTNDGAVWTNILTVSGSDRIAMAVTNANPNFVYFISSKSAGSGFNGLYRSTDSGTTFTIMSTTPNILGWNPNGSDTGGQGWYDLTLAADPQNAETIFVGGINTWKSTNGGIDWTLVSYWFNIETAQTVHADKHAMEWQGNNLWEGNDGGIYKTSNKGESWEHKSNTMVISQIYRIGVSQSDSKIIAGLQDNASKIKRIDGTWFDVLAGDGMECIINPTNASILYGSIYYGEIYRSTNGGLNWTNIHANITPSPKGAWVTPFTLIPSNPKSIVAAYKAIYKSLNQGNSWSIIGDSLLTGNVVKTILTIAPSDSMIMVTGNTASLWRTNDGGVTWLALASPGGNISRVIIHPTDPNIMWASLQNFSTGQKIFKTTNGGTSWTNVSGNLPNMPANCLVYQNGSNNGVYVGMDAGIYYKDDGMANWELFADGLPNAEVTDLEINYTTNFIFASTFGRGVWKSQVKNFIPSCLAPIAVQNTFLANNALSFSWDQNTTPVSNFEYALNLSSVPPASGSAISGFSVTVPNLISNTVYYFHIRTSCGGGSYSTWTTIGPIRTVVGCGQNFYDTGGSSMLYINEETKQWTICPNSDCTRVKATFNSMDIESEWDALYIYNGKNINAPLFASNNPVTKSGFPAGGYYGSTSPGSFTSTDTTGCLTFRFLSDWETTGSGWSASITCVTNQTKVTNHNDSGRGSIRSAISCALSGDTLTFDPSLYTGEFLVTSSPLVLDKNITIEQAVNAQINIRSLNVNPIFQVNATKTLNLKHVNLYTQGSAANRAILNNGTIKLHQCQFYDTNANAGAGSVITNQGSMNVTGNTSIIKN